MILTNYFQVKHIKNLLGHKYFYLWLAEIWTLLIAFLCLVSFNNLPSVGIKSADKYVHFTFHFVFTVLWFLYLKRKNSDKNSTLKTMLMKVFLASVIYGIFIEISQSLFTKTRHGDVLDLIANASGAIAAVLVLFFINASSIKNKIKMD